MISRSLLFLVTLIVSAGTALATPCPSLQWSPHSEIVTDGPFRSMVALDYNGDGKLDLAGVAALASDTLKTWRGAGDGTFTDETVLLTSPNEIGGYLGDVATADVNGDGHADLLVIYGDVLRIYHGTGSGLGTPVDHTGPFWGGRLTVGNFDSDPAPELVLSNASYLIFAVYDNTGGVFTETARVDTGAWPYSAASADFDGNGIHDVAIAKRLTETTGTVEIYYRAANGSFAAPLVLEAGSFPTRIASADFDGNGLPDLLLSNWYDSTVSVYRNLGSQQFEITTLLIDMPGAIGDASSILARDFNADGIVDIVAGAVNGQWLTTFVGVGDGTFRSPSFMKTDSSIWSMAAGDFDGDGDLDLAVDGSDSITSSRSSCSTQITLAPESPLISAGAEAPMLVSISGFGSTTPAPLGTITIREGSTEVGSGVPNADGTATINVLGLAVGSHTLTAEFSGNGELSAATSASVVQNVTNATTQTTISTPANAPVYGTAWPINVTVTGAGDSWITLFVDGVGTMHYSANPINLQLTPGPHTIYAKFNGTVHAPASKSDTLNVTASKAAPGLTLTGGATTVKLGQSHNLTFSVTGPQEPPTGTVQLFSGNALLTNGTLSAGTTTLSVTLPRGAHDLRAVYSGDANHLSLEMNLTLSVVANQPVAIAARGLTTAVHIAAALPDGTTSYQLYRRPAGTPAWQPVSGWNVTSGLDSFAFVRGVIYEYQLEVVAGGVTQLSNIDGALLFTDDPLIAGTTVAKRAHFTELRDAVNLMRAVAGLGAFDFSPPLTTSSVIRAADANALRTALTEARNALGMSAASFSRTITAGSTILASDLQEIRELAR